MKRNWNAYAPLLWRGLLVVFILLGAAGQASATGIMVGYPQSGIVMGLWIVVIGIVGIAILSSFNPRKFTLHLLILFGKTYKACHLAGLRLLYLPVILKTVAEIGITRCRLRYLFIKRGVVRLRLRYLLLKRDVVIHKGGWLRVIFPTNVKCPPTGATEKEVEK